MIKSITRILFSINKDDYNNDILDISIKIKYDLYYTYHKMKLNKINTVNKINVVDGVDTTVNVYENWCVIPLDSERICTTLLNKPFNDILKGCGEIYILEDDIGYNHINDVCGKIFPPKKDEISYSVYYNFFNNSSITLFVGPPKYPELLLLVLFEFLRNNDYPQDIKNCILLSYNDV